MHLLTPQNADADDFNKRVVPVAPKYLTLHSFQRNYFPPQCYDSFLLSGGGEMSI